MVYILKEVRGFPMPNQLQNGLQAKDTEVD